MCRADRSNQIRTHEAKFTSAVRPHVRCLRQEKHRRRANNMPSPVAHVQGDLGAFRTESWQEITIDPFATEPSPRGRGAGRALCELRKLLPTPQAAELVQTPHPRAPELHAKSGWHECVRRGHREK